VGEKEEVGEKGEAVTRYMRDQVGWKTLLRFNGGYQRLLTYSPGPV
jgi:hypothetical protein